MDRAPAFCLPRPTPFDHAASFAAVGSVVRCG